MNRQELIKFIKEKRPFKTSVNSKKKKELQEIYNKILEEELKIANEHIEKLNSELESKNILKHCL